MTDRRAFVRVSPRDPRYLELGDGAPYLPIGLNLVGLPPQDGLGAIERWMARLSANRGNYARVWLTEPTLDIEHGGSGTVDPAALGRVGTVLEGAARHGLRLMVSLEQFRHVGDGPPDGYARAIHHVSRGGPASSSRDIFDTAEGRAWFRRKLARYAERFGSRPEVLAWELWNEVDCVRGGDWLSWTRVMLDELHRRFPRNLATQSLGSLSRAARHERYRALCLLPQNDVAQVHRYLDLGAELPVCHGPVEALARDAVAQLLAHGIAKPLLVSEIGAVEANHTGPLKLYDRDVDGVLLHDALFAPFFAGAAGPGHTWHVAAYVDRMGLWHHFGRFAEAVRDLDPPGEGFDPIVMPHPRLRVLALSGRRTWLAWCRDARSTWRTELHEGRPPDRLTDARLAGGALPQDGVRARAYDPWRDEWAPLTLGRGDLRLPPFSRSLVVRIDRDH